MNTHNKTFVRLLIGILLLVTVAIAIGYLYLRDDNSSDSQVPEGKYPEQRIVPPPGTSFPEASTTVSGETKSNTATPPSSSSSVSGVGVISVPDETAKWKTYHSDKFGLSFQYPSGYTTLNPGKDGSIEIPPPESSDQGEHSGLLISFVPLTTEFTTDMDSNYLKYDPAAHRWNKDSGGMREGTERNYQSSCEKVFPLGKARFPAYSVVYKYHEDYVVILKQGMLRITENPVEEPIPPGARDFFTTMLDSMTFDDPTAVIKASCQ